MLLKHLPLLDSCKELAQSLRKVGIAINCLVVVETIIGVIPCRISLSFLIALVLVVVKLFGKFWSRRLLHILLKMFNPCCLQIHGLVHILYLVIDTLHYLVLFPKYAISLCAWHDNLDVYVTGNVPLLLFALFLKGVLKILYSSGCGGRG